MGTKHSKLTEMSIETKIEVQWGISGRGDGEFMHPAGVAVAINGDIYAADHRNDRIQCFSRNGLFIRKWGGVVHPRGLTICDGKQLLTPLLAAITAVPELGIFPPGVLPICASFVGDECLYVVDNDHVQVFGMEGGFIRKWGTKGNKDGQFDSPTACAIGLDSFVYVSDELNRIQVFHPHGTFIRKWGRTGTADGEFIHPTGMATTDDGLIYVADRGNFRVQCFRLDGTFVRKWGSKGCISGLFDSVYGVAVDNDGTVYVSVAPYSNAAHRMPASIQLFQADGTFVTRWLTEKFQPWHIAVAKDGSVVTAALSQDRIIVMRDLNRSM